MPLFCLFSSIVDHLGALSLFARPLYIFMFSGYLSFDLRIDPCGWWAVCLYTSKFFDHVYPGIFWDDPSGSFYMWICFWSLFIWSFWSPRIFFPTLSRLILGWSLFLFLMFLILWSMVLLVRYWFVFLFPVAIYCFFVFLFGLLLFFHSYCVLVICGLSL